MKLKRILIVMALAGSSVALKAMDDDVLQTAFGKFEAKTKEKEKEYAETRHALEIAQKRGVENKAQKDTITKLEKEISSLQAKLFFWRTPAVLAGLAAAAYGSWVAYEWWTANNNSNAVNESSSSETLSDDAANASSTNSDGDTQDQNSDVESTDESSQDAGPVDSTISDTAPTTAHDVLTVPNSTPPDRQD